MRLLTNVEVKCVTVTRESGLERHTRVVVSCHHTRVVVSCHPCRGVTSADQTVVREGCALG